MNRFIWKFSITLLLVVAMSGCCLRRQSPETCCPPYVSGRTPISVSEKSIEDAVSYDFKNLPSYDESKKSILGQVAADAVIRINLNEVIQLAAKNSELADLIESERHSLKCQTGQDNCEATALDTILAGEANEHRNMAAGSAAEIFLGLVQVTMQMELLEESKRHVAELEATIQAADEAGFATIEGKNEVEKAKVQVRRFESELNSAHQKLTYQLNLLININEQNPIVFQPVHHLAPQEPNFDVRSEVAIAETHRPGIQSLQAALAQGGNGEALYKLLGIFDRRIGIKLPVPPSAKLLLRSRIADLLKSQASMDSSSRNRRQQSQQILDTRKKQARVAAGEAMLKQQTAFEKLTLVNEDIARLNSQRALLKANQELDAQGAYLQLHENWVELQQARADRIVAAIEVESQGIQLKQAQGRLLNGQN